jgi:hypothetical protein
MEETELGRITFESEQKPEKHEYPSEITEFGIVMKESEMHP